ncbi:MAG: spore coat protein CotJB [Eubacteriales bacterium]|nr:spore coat protein CotJB [Eubacteriales bacterium]
MENMCKEDLKALIQSTNFALIDLSLYLDTHPKCSYALETFYDNRKTLMKALHIYEKRFGCLTIYGHQEKDIWDWKDEPWPWQKECDC